MINEVRTVRDRCFAHTGGTTPDLSIVTNAFKAYTSIDKVLFVGYQSDPLNPIIGQFWKWHQLIPYGSPETCVEVRYALRLEHDEPLKRLVVCKEICHALDSKKGSHSISDNAVGDLAALFALNSASRPLGNLSTPFVAEMLAEIAAYEILMPSSHRQKMVQTGEYASIGDVGVAARYEIPVKDISYLFVPTFLDATLKLFP